MLCWSNIVINLYNFTQFPYREFIVHIINNRCAVDLMDSIWFGWSTTEFVGKTLLNWQSDILAISWFHYLSYLTRLVGGSSSFTHLRSLYAQNKMSYRRWSLFNVNLLTPKKDPLMTKTESEREHHGVWFWRANYISQWTGWADQVNGWMSRLLCSALYRLVRFKRSPCSWV